MPVGEEGGEKERERKGGEGGRGGASESEDLVLKTSVAGELIGTEPSCTQVQKIVSSFL